MPDLWTCLLALGAAARLTRLITDDRIAAPVRALAIRARGPESELAWLVQCPWCIGLWISAAVTVVAYLSHGAVWFTAPALALTISHLVALAAARLDN